MALPRRLEPSGQGRDSSIEGTAKARFPGVKGACGAYFRLLVALKLFTILPRVFRRNRRDETILRRHETIFPFSCRRPETWPH
jgi:hypothetical protein